MRLGNFGLSSEAEEWYEKRGNVTAVIQKCAIKELPSK